MTLRWVMALCTVGVLVAATGIFAHALKRVSPLRWWMNVLIPGLQAVFMALILVYCIKADYPLFVFAAIVVLGILCGVVDFSLLKHLRAAEDKELAEERARLLDEQVALQEEHLEHLRSETDHVRKAQEELVGELRRALDDLRAADAHDLESGALRRQGLAKIELESKGRYCENPVADALLVSRARICQQKGIRLSFSGDVPEDVGISNVGMCAVFANLLDNAVAACEEAGVGAFVDVRARVAKGFLVVETLNSCVGAKDGESKDAALAVAGGSPEKDADDPFRRHGWGLFILAGVAEHHGGTLLAEREGDVFRTTIMLRADV